MKQFNLEEYIKNPSRKVVTRDGCPVKIICINFHLSSCPIVAEIDDKEYGNKQSWEFNKDGKYDVYKSHRYDLFFAPEKHEGWARICFNNGEYYLDNIIYPSKADAKNHADKLVNTVAAVKIEWEE